MEKLLDIKDLHVEYRTDMGTVYAVNGLDLSLEPGQTLGLVGETGAGKTTASLAVMRLLPDKIGVITRGEIVLDGLKVTKAGEREMRAIRGDLVSMIFQDPMTSLNPTLTVGDQIGEVLVIHNEKRLSKREIGRTVDEMLELVGIPASRKHDYPHQFSGGMKQRIVIAIALACNPKLLIADEPTTALDVTIQAQVLDMMRDLKEKFGMAMILITHDLGVVAETCDHVAIMYAGEVIENGTVEDIFLGQKHHPYTTGLFGSIPSLKKETRRLNAIDGLMPDPTVLPPGCRFADRCRFRMEICNHTPPKVLTEGTHSLRCHLFTKPGEGKP